MATDVTRLLTLVVVFSLLTILLLTSAELILTISSLGRERAGAGVTPGDLRLSTAPTAGNYEDNGHLQGPSTPNVNVLRYDETMEWSEMYLAESEVDETD